MSDYTIKNMMDIEVSGGGRAPGIEARFARSHIDSEQIGLTRMSYEPDTRSPMGHSHREQEEVYLILAGSGHMKLNDEILDVRPWDIVRVAPSTVRGFESGPDGLDLIAVGSARPADGDGVRAAEDWWSD
jgi:mannose-6-phosphate isomerase-like protein (cupin superfamily)